MESESNGRKKIAIIGANEFQRPLIRKANELGYETHVFAWQQGSVGAKDAYRYYPISIVDKEEILAECRKIGVDGVATIGSDLGAITVSYLAEQMGLTGNTKKCQVLSTNKYQMRKAFAEAGIAVPEFELVDTSDCLAKFRERNMKLPLIVKPTDRSGSRAVTLVLTEEELKGAVAAAVECSFQKKAIMESFLHGSEYSCECMSVHGDHHFLAMTKKFTTGYPHYIETGHLEPSGLDRDTEERAVSTVIKALDALKIMEGASHSEFRIDADGEIHMIEVGARMGGDCIGSHLVWLSTGYDFLKMVIDNAVGQPVVFEQAHPSQVAYIRFVHDMEDYVLFRQIQERFPNRICESFGLQDFSTERMHDVTDSSSRYGYYIVTCRTVEDLEETIGREQLDELE